VVSRSRAPEQSAAIARALDGECIAMGSAGAKAMAVLRGDADIYLHSGGQYAWDNCAPAAVALAAGLHVSRIDGQPLRYNCADTYVPDLLITHPDWAARALAAVAMG
jgi:3'(2'), 5'-bisphosphate nucleotidase